MKTNLANDDGGKLSVVAVESKPEYSLVREMRITIPKDYNPVGLMRAEKDITTEYNDHVLTWVRDDSGLCLYSCKRKGDQQMDLFKERLDRAVAELLPGKEYVVKMFRPITRHRNPEDAGALSFLMTQSHNILTGAQGLSIVWPIAKDNLSKYDALVTFDCKGVMWVCGVGQENAIDLGGIPHALKPDAPGSVEDYFGTFSDEWDGDYFLFCICELGA